MTPFLLAIVITYTAANIATLILVKRAFSRPHPMNDIILQELRAKLDTLTHDNQQLKTRLADEERSDRNARRRARYQEAKQQRAGQ